MRRNIGAAAALFGVLSHPQRLHVLTLLGERQPRSAGELQEHTGLERTALSHQLRILREARLVCTNRDGRRQLYSLVDRHVAHIVRDAMIHVAEDS